MSTPPSTLGVRHVALRCRDVRRLEAFYVEILGYAVEWRPDGQSVYLTSGLDNLALHEDPDVPTTTRLDHLGILLRTPSDVDQWAAALRVRGVEPDTEPKTHRDGCRSFYIRDPEGNRIQFLWHPQVSDPKPAA
jgi:catechol 2,3-dioxygenase-like lactoylglutathione lyase family enzyme